MESKYYAVRIGKKPGIYRTWDDCKAQVFKYPGAIYKSFKTYEEAVNFVNSPSFDSIKEEDLFNLPYGSAVAYVDGSFNTETNEYGFGVVFFLNGEEKHFSGKGVDEELASMRNVAGEIKASECAMQYALENEITKLTIYHDYEGIARWCLGEWKTNKAGTIAYKAFYDDISKNIEISFVKVKGHSGNTYNDLADELAKSQIFE